MFGKKHAAETGRKKYLYLFEEGNKDMRELLGGKGANLAEMTNAGMPVPPGFTITTEACTQYYKDGRQINDECPRFHARYDGYHPEPGPERRGGAGPGQADQQPPLCLRQLPPLYPDVLRRGDGAFQEAL